MTDRERFTELCAQIKRNGIHEFLIWLFNETDFYEAPASTKFHAAYEGGLLKHSLNVYDEFNRLLDAYAGAIKPPDPDSVKICALFHDICKVNFYTPEKRNRKNAEGKWEQYDGYTINEKFHYGGHGSKSVFLLQHFLDLKPEEAVAINCHMSCWDGNKDVGAAFEQFPFAWLLHVADEAATYVCEVEKNA